MTSGLFVDDDISPCKPAWSEQASFTNLINKDIFQRLTINFLQKEKL